MVTEAILTGVFFFFVDGLGLGSDDPAKNPLVSAHLPTLTALCGGRRLTQGELGQGRLVPPGEGACVAVLDPAMGVAGLPQSATGQTALFTGRNAPAIMGHHVNGYPTPTLRRVLLSDSIFKRVAMHGGRVTFLNPFRPPSWERLLAAEPPADVSASTLAFFAARQPFRSLADLAAGQAVALDMTGRVLRDRGFDVLPVSAWEAGAIAAKVASRYDLTLYESFVTDLAGHAQHERLARDILENIDRFVAAFVAEASDTLLVLTSDHGNVEDLSVKTHTKNPVPALVYGPDQATVASGWHDLADVARGVLRYLGISENHAD